MSDEQMQPLLEAWFKDTDPTPPDTRQTAVEVMVRVPQTRQRGRWWPFPVFRRKTQTATATGTTEYQPSPIPATNGHAPTVIGRTQTMFSPVKAITAGALVFALGGMLLIAQPFDQQGSVPGAEQAAELAPPAYGVRINVTYSEDSDSDQFSATDSRLSGTVTSQNVEYDGGDGLEVGSIRIVNDEGTWVGTAVGIGSRQANLGVTTLTGEGAYEGLTAFLVEDFDNYDDHLGEFIIRGFIVEGELPPFPEMPAE